MTIIDILMKMPCWYLSILIIFSLFYGIREIMDRKYIRLKDKNKIDTSEKVIIYYVRDFLSEVIFSISGFTSLLIANFILSSIESFNDVGVGTAILLIFLILWGVTGVSGYLKYIVVAGKLQGKPSA